MCFSDESYYDGIPIVQMGDECCEHSCMAGFSCKKVPNINYYKKTPHHILTLEGYMMVYTKTAINTYSQTLHGFTVWNKFLTYLQSCQSAFLICCQDPKGSYFCFIKVHLKMTTVHPFLDIIQAVAKRFSSLYFHLGYGGVKFLLKDMIISVCMYSDGWWHYGTHCAHMCIV